MHTDTPSLHTRLRGAAFFLLTCIALGLSFIGLIAAMAPDTLGHVEERVIVETETEYLPASHRYSEDDILWMARAIYSETKIPAEMEYIAWIIRQRVDSERYPDKPEAVVLQWRQFSAFNSASRRAELAEYTRDSRSTHFRRALRMAHYTLIADPELSPFPEVLHAYSPQSMQPAGRVPRWAEGQEAVYAIDGRWRFYAGIQ